MKSHCLGRAIAIAAASLLCACDLQLGIPAGLIPFGDASIEASRLSGVAPLCVVFVAEAGSPVDGGRSFHDCEFAWDFGDEGGGKWGTSGRPRNEAKGGVAAHVFEAPGTYTVTMTVRDSSGIAASSNVRIKVEDPGLVYAGEKTVCVSTGADFSGAPAGSLNLTTGDLSTVTQYATAGRRILFRRGDSWSAAGLSWPSNAGPVTLGAFGAATGVDALGIAANAPAIIVTSGSFLPLDGKQDWRFMDLRLIDATKTCGSIGGNQEMQRDLFLRMKVEGFETSLGWSHWNTSRLMAVEQMAIVSCDVSGGGSNVVYVGGEHLAVLGNIIRDADESHVLRVWQAYKGVISENLVSGSSLTSGAGRHALKLHGPGYSTLHGVNELGAPSPGTGLLEHKTEYVVVSGNVFGSSGPWPVVIGPQDALTDAEVSNVVFERNLVCSAYGSQSSTPVNTAVHVWAHDVTLRNNVFDGTGSAGDYTGIYIDRYGSEPAPERVVVCNNTIYRKDNAAGNFRIGIDIGPGASDTSVWNNLVAFPGTSSAIAARLVQNAGKATDFAANLYLEVPGFIDPDNPNPLSRNFRLNVPYPTINREKNIYNYDDFDGRRRPSNKFEIGAFEWRP